MGFFFFSAIAATIGGGLVSLYQPAPQPDLHYEDQRIPASSRNTNSPGASNNRVDPGLRGGRSSYGGGGMPANYDDRSSNQSRDGGNTATPISVTPDPSNAQNPAMAQGAQARALAELAHSHKLNQNELAESTSTGTSTSTGNDTIIYNSVGSPSSTETSTSTSTSTTSSLPVYQNLSATGTSIPGLCTPITLTLYNSSFVATAPGSDTPVFLTATAGSIYSNSACTATTTQVTVAASATSGTFYFRYDAAGTVSITAQHSSFNTSSVSITLSVPEASLVLGQANYTSSAANAGGVAASNTLNEPYHTVRTGNYLFAADTANHRVLVWTSQPSSNQQAASFALGQPDLVSDTANNGGISAQTLNGPGYVHTDGTRLFVADRLNNRVLIWSALPTSAQEAANIVLGQPDMTSNAANNGGVSLSSLSDPECVFSDGTRLLVCDTGNHRVLIWNSIPTADNQAADVVVGQTDGTSNTANAGAAVSALGLDSPYIALIASSKLLVADTNNNRVLVWSSIPTSHGESASVSIGQTSLTDSTNNSGGLSAASLSSPAGLVVDSVGKLGVVDFNNNRVLLWNSIPTDHFTFADSVIGQSTFTTNGANQGGISASTLNGPWGLDLINDELWVSDWGNHRVLKHTWP